MPDRLLIAIDYDGTFTADPVLWRNFIDSASVRGHQVICVSAREDCDSQRQELRAALPDLVSVILLSYSESKRRFAERHGFIVDIWLDDFPDAVVRNFDGTEEDVRIAEILAENKSAWDEVARLRIAVDEARRCRDNARNEAAEQVQSEMAALRKELNKLKRETA